jgi:hypothetical protein
MRGLLTMACVGTAALCLATGTAFADDATASDCNGDGSTALVNVTFTLTNDADSGFAGNAWADDTIHRTLRIWAEPDGSFCAVVHDTGSFATYAGASPSGNDTVSAGIEGGIHGGYVATIQGTLAASPDYPTSGNLGTFDLGCGQTFTCPGARPSLTSYVDVSSYDLPTWGWTYRTPHDGTWVNASTGSSGDIAG